MTSPRCSGCLWRVRSSVSLRRSAPGLTVRGGREPASCPAGTYIITFPAHTWLPLPPPSPEACSESGRCSPFRVETFVSLGFPGPARSFPALGRASFGSVRKDSGRRLAATLHLYGLSALDTFGIKGEGYTRTSAFTPSLMAHLCCLSVCLCSHLSPGDPHQFEQKFNYRRPMYPILRYMWGTDAYRESIKVRAFGRPNAYLSLASGKPVSCGSVLKWFSLGLGLTGFG